MKILAFMTEPFRHFAVAVLRSSPATSDSFEAARMRTIHRILNHLEQRAFRRRAPPEPSRAHGSLSSPTSFLKPTLDVCLNPRPFIEPSPKARVAAVPFCPRPLQQINTPAREARILLIAKPLTDTT